MTSPLSTRTFPRPLTTIRESLSGKNAFYNQSNYLNATAFDFSQKIALPVAYTWNSEPRAIRIAKLVASIIFLPLGIYKLLHGLIGMVVVPASSPTLMRHPENHADELRKQVVLDGDWKYKRLTIEVDGYKIDATLFGKADTLSNGRWVLASIGNGEFCENKLLHERDFKAVLSAVNGNGLVFSYPGVGSSSGLPNKEAMAKAYRAMLAFLEDEQKGIGAKEILGYGHSIGGGVQGEALKNHELKKGIKYVFIKSRTFSDLSTAVSFITGSKLLAFLTKVFGWNMNSVESSRNLQVPEIIMQTANVPEINTQIANVPTCQILTASSQIVSDGVIPAKASLAKALLEDHSCPKDRKVFIGIHKFHNAYLDNFDLAFLAGKIEEGFLSE